MANGQAISELESAAQPSGLRRVDPRASSWITPKCGLYHDAEPGSDRRFGGIIAGFACRRHWFHAFSSIDDAHDWLRPCFSASERTARAYCPGDRGRWSHVHAGCQLVHRTDHSGSRANASNLARGKPTVLDLVVAVASAAAAAYALARPNLIGSIAGVAIATALVPPLCSVGLSLAYADTTNALGAALLFATNFLAIVLSAALTFRIIGITAKQAELRQKFWVFRVVGILGLAAILVCFPLHHALLKSLVETKPQPRAFPLAKTVIDALEDRLGSHPDTNLITAGRPSSHLVSADVVLVLGTTGELDSSFADELVEIVRQKMQDESLSVEVHCVQELWQETTQ